jgi:hypothetical protein
MTYGQIRYNFAVNRSIVEPLAQSPRASLRFDRWALPAVFLTAFLVRLVYVLVIATDPYALLNDAPIYVDISRQFARGDYSGMFLDRFVTAPLYPFLVSLLMKATAHWLAALLLLQVAVSAGSCLAVVRLAEIWFKDRAVGFMAGMLHALNPFMFYYTGTVSTETLFMSFMLISIYTLEVSLDARDLRWTALSALIFGAAYLLKSPLLLLSPFLAIYIWQRLGSLPAAFRHVALFAAVSFSVSLPYGLYHLNRGDGYILSSNGFETLFLWGNSNFGSTFTRLDDPQSKADFQRMDWCKYDPEACRYQGLPAREQQSGYFKYALRWIRANPVKFIKLKLFHVYAFLRPGLVPQLHPWRLVLTSRLVWIPLYALALFAWFKVAAYPTRQLLVYAFLSVLMFTLLTYVQGRFRNLILEPFIGMYAAAGLSALLRKTRWAAASSA